MERDSTKERVHAPIMNHVVVVLRKHGLALSHHTESSCQESVCLLGIDLWRFHHYLPTVVNIDARLQRTPANLVALQRPPVRVVVVGCHAVDAGRQITQVDDVRLPRRTDVLVGGVCEMVVEDDELVVGAGTKLDSLSTAFACNDEIVESVLSTSGASTFAIHKGCHFASVHDFLSIHQLNDHRHVVGISACLHR